MMMLWGCSNWEVHFDGKDVVFRLDAVCTISLMSRELKDRKHSE
jgi:hypothetical protein